MGGQIMTLRLLTLDVNNTILKFRTSPAEQYAAVAQLYGINVDKDKLQKSFRLSFKHQEREFSNFGAKKIHWSKWWLSVVTNTFRGAGCTADDKTLKAVGHHLIKHFSTAYPYDVIEGTVPLLELIRSNTEKLGLISNSDDRLEGILIQLGLRKYFDFVVLSYSIKAAKPDPFIFSQALRSAGNDIKPVEALHIGDNLKCDYLGARTSGWQSILVHSDYPQVCKDGGITPDHSFMFRNLHELLPVMSEKY